MKFIAISALAAVGAAQYAAPAPAPAPVAPVYAAPAPAPVAPVYAAPAPAPAAYAAPAPAPAAYAPAPAAYGAPPPAPYAAPAAYGPAPVTPVPFALVAGKAMLSRFCLAPHPGSPLAQALAALQALLQALTLGASDAQIAGCAQWVAVNYNDTNNNFFSCLAAPSCNAGTLSPCVAGTTCTQFTNSGLLGGPGFCANTPNPAN